MPNYIRVKQINQAELTGFFVDSISSESGLLLDFAEQAALAVFSSGTVLLTGNQNVSGIKTFFNSINISGDLTVNGSIRANEIIDFTVTGDISGYTGQFQALYVKGEPVVTGSVATASSLFQTGENLYNYINALSGTLNNSGAVLYTYITQLSGDFDTSGAILNSYINNLSGYVTGTDATLANNLANTGSTLDVKIDNLSGDFNQTGALLHDYINDLSGISVLKYGDQTISGVKTLRDTLSVSSISGISGSTLININAINNAEEIFGGNYLGGGINLTAGSGNFVGGSINLFAGPKVDTPYHGNIGVFGNVGINNHNSSVKSVIIYKTGAVATEVNVWVQQSSVDVNNAFSISGVQVTPAIYVDRVNNQNISGVKTFATGIFAPNLVYNTGNQTISGVKTFIGNHIISGDTIITGHLSATSKSFLIDHPTQTNKKLQYGSLEGPEHGVFVRGKTNENIINLPNYWPALVDENSISVNLTPIDVFSNIYVVEYNNRRIVTDGNNGNYYFYTVYGERKDIPKLTVEF